MVTIEAAMWHHGDMPSVSPAFDLFVGEWFSGSPMIEVQTSGSTGAPKRIDISKQAMRQSARLTCSELGLKEGDRALLCMPLQYIGAKMMVVRAIEAGLDLVVSEPCSHPMREVEGRIDFAAMTPFQAYHSLESFEERRRLEAVRSLLIGGGAIDARLERQLASFPHAVYSTYGMTETVSHIALRRLNGPNASAFYRPFDGVRLSLSPHGTLVIDAPGITDGPVVTRDLARINPDGSFGILGRSDNVINSGGIKLHAEHIERKLECVMPCGFAVTSAPDPQFGEALVLLTECALCDEMLARIKSMLTRYELPRRIQTVSTLPRTGNGKIDRAACRRIAGKALAQAAADGMK